MYNTQNYWVFGLCQSSGILETRKHDVSETGSVSVLRRGGRHLVRHPTDQWHLLFTVPLETVQWPLVQWLGESISDASNLVGSPSPEEGSRYGYEKVNFFLNITKEAEFSEEYFADSAQLADYFFDTEDVDDMFLRNAELSLYCYQLIKLVTKAWLTLWPQTRNCHPCVSLSENLPVNKRRQISMNGSWSGQYCYLLSIGNFFWISR
jgi:hypothetical protein